MKASPFMMIGEVADSFGLPAHVLRHWESVGLLTPERVGGQRGYSRDDLYRIGAILQAKQAGFGLEAIREMLTTDDPEARKRMLRRHRDDLAERIARARASLELIESAIGCEHDDFVLCPNFRAMVAERVTIMC
ncbi:MerR family transcriptional regulator [Nonomuraea sp. NBC_01738]|uniref:helix-turn-helix domain-containing protein n=1 Tax=Nonomuraea sp. NBC_01738 TaxID=2976003 RepID=UPI002E139812|nr:MerR family transcriptional regulator [Nonomuraea sp. NBC_01738]